MLKHHSKPRSSKVPTFHETCLTSSEVAEYLSAFEARYGFSSADFLRHGELRNGVTEDDSFMWQAYIDHAGELRRTNEETHRDYLSRLSRNSSSEESDRSSYLVAVAA